MATTIIPWADGTGSITLDYTGSGSGTVTVTSDANNLYTSRSQVISVKAGTITRQVTVTQRAIAVQGSFAGYPVSCSRPPIGTFAPTANAMASSNSTDRASFDATLSSGEENYVYLYFDCSSIPANATIKSVSCIAKCFANSTSDSSTLAQKIQLFAGSTAKGSASGITTDSSLHDLDTGTWTPAELQDACLRLYAKNISGSSTRVLIYFYGATLTVEYEYEVAILTSYDSGYSAYSVSNLDNALAGADNTSYARIYLTRGANAVTEIFYNFGSLNVPSEATTISVSCSCKCNFNKGLSQVVTSEAQLYSGTTAMGTASTVASSNTAFDISGGTWTAAQLMGGVKLRLYAVRANKDDTSSSYFQLYGATLTITYGQ